MKAKLAFLNRKELHDNFDWATFWATFSQKSSGHPGKESNLLISENVIFLQKKCPPMKWDILSNRFFLARAPFSRHFFREQFSSIHGNALEVLAIQTLAPFTCSLPLSLLSQRDNCSTDLPTSFCSKSRRFER
jgi:hypothetical protein